MSEPRRGPGFPKQAARLGVGKRDSDLSFTPRLQPGGKALAPDLSNRFNRLEWAEWMTLRVNASQQLASKVECAQHPKLTARVTNQTVKTVSLFSIGFRSPG